MNSVGGYCLGKFDKRNKLEVIFDKEIKHPKKIDRKKLTNIFKLFWKFA